jgi:hypothetical protein
MRKALLVATAALSFLVVAGAPALAQTDVGDLNDHVVLTGRLIVPEGETVGTAVIFNGHATVLGTVEESLVVTNGDAEVSGTVHGDVIVVNGTLRVRDGAVVDGDLITRRAARVDPGATVRGDEQRITGRWDFADIGFASRFAWWLGFTVSTLILGLVLLLFAPGLDPALSWTARQRLGGAVGFGAAAFFLLPIAAVLLLITVVGIPLGLLLLFALGLVYTVGYVAGAHAIGRLIVKSPTSRYLAFLAGLAIVRLLALIPVLGGLTWLVVSVLGLGALLVAVRRTPAAPGAADPLPPAPPMPA